MCQIFQDISSGWDRNRYFTLVVACICFAPAYLASILVTQTANTSNVCFVGPIKTIFPDKASRIFSTGRKEYSRLSMALFGTYKPSPEKFFHYSKLPFMHSNSMCFTGSIIGSCAWPSATNILSNLSPRGIRVAKELWQKRVDLSDDNLSYLNDEEELISLGEGEYPVNDAKRLSRSEEDTISYDGAIHRRRENMLKDQEEFMKDSREISISSIEWDIQNCWCIISEYIPDGRNDGEQKIKICSHTQPTIISDSLTKPFFSELPLSPPPSGIWYSTMSIADPMIVHKVQVKCHVSSSYTMQSARNGTIDRVPDGGGDYPTINWNILSMPATLFIMILQIAIFINNSMWRVFNYIPKSLLKFLNKSYDFQNSSELQRNDKDKLSNNANKEGAIQNHVVQGSPYLTYVAARHDKIMNVHSGELWRIVVAPFTHFHLSHLLFSLFNLYWIGATLEEDFGIFPFLYMNIAIAILTGIMTLILIDIRIKRKRQQKLSTLYLETKPLIGYTPILFSWIIVAFMERHELFLSPWSDLSFPTIQLFPSVLVNVTPVIFLVLARIVTFDSSFLSHLSGCACGVLVHYNFLSEILLRPDILIPLLLLYYFGRNNEGMIFWKREFQPKQGYNMDYRNHIRYERLDTLLQSDDDDSSVDIEIEQFFYGNGGTGNFVIKEVTEFEKFIIPILKALLFTNILISVCMFEHGMAFGQLLCTLLFFKGVQSWTSTPEQNGYGSAIEESILPSYFLVKAIVIIMDSMTVGVWLAANTFITSDSMISFSAELVRLFITMRLSINLLGFIVVRNMLRKNNDVFFFGLSFNITRWTISSERKPNT